MNLVKQAIAAEQAVHEHCGYKQDWVHIPLRDETDAWWAVDPGERVWLRYAETKEQLDRWFSDGNSDACGGVWEDSIYTQRFLPRWVYRGPVLTIVCADPHVDGNRFLRVFLTEREVKPPVGVTVRNWWTPPPDWKPPVGEQS